MAIIPILYELSNKHGKKNDFVNHDETQPVDLIYVYVSINIFKSICFV